MDRYVLDACALTAFVYDETGADIVQNILETSETGVADVYMNKLNFLEVYYNIRRSEGYELSERFYDRVLKMPIKIISHISDEVFKEAGRIKSKYKISLADSIALAESSVLGARILTCDHHEFDAIEGKEPIRFYWIR